MADAHDHQAHAHPHTHVPGAAPGAGSGGDKLPGIRHVVAVGSGKGGVGKSTVAVNLALALRQEGNRVGLVDADVLGPSIPTLLGLPKDQPPQASESGRMLPAQRFGISAVSMGMLRGDDNPAIMRGPMVSKYLQMFIAQVEWGTLDYLILDLPPGTGDIQLTLAQSLQLSGVVIVTTPQDVSLNIARRGLRMFETVHVPILGIIENMGPFVCPHCGEATEVFSSGGGGDMSRALDVPFLGSLPLDAEIVRGGDLGQPIVVANPLSTSAKNYTLIARELAGIVEGQPATSIGAFSWDWGTNEGSPGWFEGAVVEGGSPLTPVGFAQRDPRTLSVLWQDGRRDDLDVRDLRLACPCAQCVEEMSGQPLLDPSSVLADVTPRAITGVGTYAVIINWSDGHNTGIYTFEHLRRVAERDAPVLVEDV